MTSLACRLAHRPNRCRTTTTTSNDSDSGDADDNDEEGTPPPAFDIDILLADGNRVSVASEAAATLAPPLKVRYLKHAGNNSSQYNDEWEPVLQYFEVPLSLLVGERPVADIREIALRFGRGCRGRRYRRRHRNPKRVGRRPHGG